MKKEDQEAGVGGQESDGKNPFKGFPRLGHFVRLPGGVMWCQEWEVRRERNSSTLSGKIVFEFDMNSADYDAALDETKLIEAREVPKLMISNVTAQTRTPND